MTKVPHARILVKAFDGQDDVHSSRATDINEANWGVLSALLTQLIIAETELIEKMRSLKPTWEISEEEAEGEDDIPEEDDLNG